MIELALPVLVVIAAIGAGAILLRKKKPALGEEDSLSNRMQKLLHDGKYGQAADIARRQENYAQAMEFYLRAQQPENAAHMALRLGDHRKAAELFERVGDADNAILHYERAGLIDKANELRKENTESLQATSKVDENDLVAVFQEAKLKGVKNDDDRIHLQRLASRAAEYLLDQGELKEAARIYAEGGLEDEAIHLYMNALGSPGEAAPIFAARGDHKRAAELYEQAGMRERAAQNFVHASDASSNPAEYLDQIEKLSPHTAKTFLLDRTRNKEIQAQTAELHYRLARLMEKSEELEGALKIYAAICTSLGDYKDVVSRRETLILKTGGTPATNANLTTSQRQVIDEKNVVPPAPPSSDALAKAATLSDDQLNSLAAQVMQAVANESSREGNLFEKLSHAASVSVNHETPVYTVTGIESRPVEMERLVDSAVIAARSGPSVEELRGFIKDNSCDLQNIEVYYRLGLALLSQGYWADAQQAFQAVEDCSPGYRDASSRARAIAGWIQAIPSHVLQGTLQGVGEGAPLAERNNSAPAVKDDGRYEIVGELGRGGMAVVYRGMDNVLGREVALKFLTEELVEHEDALRMFEREAKAVAALNHPGIVTIYDFGVRESRVFICMELVKGRSLEDLLVEGEILPIIETISLMRDALKALQYAHNESIIHRDLKPANMMRTHDGRMKLMDFGLAKSMTEKKSSMIAGTPAYMSPEQLTGVDVDHRTDIFAMGVTLYELLTTELPFQGYERHKPPLPMSEHIPAIPPILDDLVAKSIAPDPDDRFQSCDEMVEGLEELLFAVGKFAREKMPEAAAAIEKKTAAATKDLPKHEQGTVVIKKTIDV